MTITTFRTARSVDGTPLPLANFDELVDALLEAGGEFGRKEDAPLWSPALFDGPRAAKSVTQVNYLVFDVDEQVEFQPFPWRHAVHTTWSGGYRVVIETDRPVLPAEWPAFWREMARRMGELGVTVDPACSDASRIYYVPSCQDGGVADFWEGGERPVYVDDVLASVSAAVPEAPEPAPPGVRYPLAALVQKAQGAMLGKASTLKAQASHLYRALRGESLGDEGGRNNALLAATWALAVLAPDVDEDHAVALLAPALAATPGPDAPTGSEARSMLARALAKVREEARAEKLREAAAGSDATRALARAYGLQRTATYAPEEIGEWAKAAGLTEEMFLRTRLVVRAAGQFFFFLDGGYAGPFEGGMTAAATAKPFLAMFDREEITPYAETKTGRRLLGPAELLDRYGSTAEQWAVDLRAGYTTFDGRTLVHASCPMRPLVPTYWPEVEEWLRHMCGPSYDDVALWLSRLPDLDRTLAALFLEGPRGAGKSTFARGCARLWADDCVTAESAMGHFNDAVARCPVVFADEMIPHDHRGQPRTAELRRLVQETSRPLRRKHVAEAEMRGCVRVIVAANRADVFYGDELTVADQEAIAERVYRVECRTGYKIPKAITRGTALAEHALWLAEQGLPDTDKRFLIESPDADFHVEQAALAPQQSAALHWMVAFLRDPRKIDALGSKVAVVRDGRLEVTSRALTQYWSMYETNRRPPTAAQVAHALRALSDERVARGGETYWVIGQRYLEAWVRKTGFCEVSAVKDALALTEARKRDSVLS